MRNKSSKKEYHNITLTDIQPHASIPRFPKNKIEKNIRQKRPGRIICRITGIDEKTHTIRFVAEMPKGLKTKVHFPSQGLPMIIGRDVFEKITALKKKGIRL